MNQMEVDDAFQFFGLDRVATEEIFKHKFHELALKYHPDKGEFNSDVIFLELMKHRHTLEEFFENRHNHEEVFRKSAATNDYALYKEAKQLQNDSILKYFKEREKFNNKTLPNADFEIQLKEELKIAKSKYLELIREYPKSLWIRDSTDSIQSIDIWLK
ncbi:MAG: hypothetical protein KBA66_16480 [Leptospiraceae bacterium]|nr:hypothetical protein [Leptospiraceae bacterium]